MAVVCPYCACVHDFRAVRPGPYEMSCSRCGKAFRLRVAEGAVPAARERTHAPGTPGGDNADFSLAAGAVEATEALDVSHAAVPVADLPEVPASLGRYQVLRELGRGGMGAVYLARQLSLGRLVALKVMNRRWARDAAFLARFTREAYAAAQLVHPNIVQVHDLGSDRGIHYFSMEYVDGPSLGEQVKRHGPLRPEVAAGYVLQAARGLAFAHERGMIHRDVKPDNLLLDSRGIVKVADLGLVRTPDASDPPLVAVGGQAGSSQVTQARQTMGTPAYMAPEQARDASRIDHRADIYSLGCTLYVLVTGRPVFQGSNPLEVLARHASEPVVRPERLCKDVPPALSDIIVRMIAKRPEDRPASMAEVIRSLEDFLGLHGQTGPAGSRHNVRILEESVRTFHEAPTARLRARILLGASLGWSSLLALALLAGWWRLAGSLIGLGSLTALACFLIRGAAQGDPLFQRVRDRLLQGGVLTWSKRLAGLLLLAILLYLMGLLWIWAAFGVLALGLAMTLHLTLDRQVAAQRAPALARVDEMLRGLRSQGVSEEALRSFVCQHAGEHWEEFYEHLFGYEAKLAARSRETGRSRPGFAAWRDPLIRWLDARANALQEARQVEHLRQVEQQGLEARGVAVPEARAQADAAAEAMVQTAVQIRQDLPSEPDLPAAREPVPARPARPPRRVTVQEMYRAADELPPPRRRRTPLLGRLLARIFRGGPRLLLGCVLVGICVAWLHTRGLLPSSGFDELATYRTVWEKAEQAAPLTAPPIPDAWLRLVCTLPAGVAGVLLILSAAWHSWRIGVLVLLGAGIIIAGPLWPAIPAVGTHPPQTVCLVAGAAVALIGFLFGRDT